MRGCHPVAPFLPVFAQTYLNSFPITHYLTLSRVRTAPRIQAVIRQQVTLRSRIRDRPGFSPIGENTVLCYSCESEHSAESSAQKKLQHGDGKYSMSAGVS